MWKVKNESDNKMDTCQRIKEALEALPGKITQIKELEVGINYNTSETAYDISLYTGFDSKEDLNAYQINPDHKEVGALIKSLTTARAVSDYEV